MRDIARSRLPALELRKLAAHRAPRTLANRSIRSDFDDCHRQVCEYVHLIVIESNNGESLSHGRSSKPKRHNAKLCPFAIRQRIVNALANGDSKRAIARALRVSNNTVTAIAEQEWQQVAARKARLAAQWEQVATKAVDQLNDHLDASTLPPNALVPIAGVATDKLLALSADPALTQSQQHLHLHLQSTDIARQFNDLLRSLQSTAGQAPSLALTDETTEQRE